MTITMTSALQQIAEAVRTLRHMPYIGIKQRFNYWPDVVQRFCDAYGYTSATYRVRPTARQITRMDEALNWLTWMDGDTAKILWALAENYSWRKIAALAGKPPKKCQELCRIALYLIVYRINNPQAKKRSGYGYKNPIKK